jgi:hypothetical protein
VDTFNPSDHPRGAGGKFVPKPASPRPASTLASLRATAVSTKETAPHPTIRPDGTEEWLQDGKRHRTDGPAVVRPDGTEEWWEDDRLHRTDGPAVVQSNGTEEWWQNGKLHRTDGPAIIWLGDTEEWWQNGKRVPAPSTPSQS